MTRGWECPECGYLCRGYSAPEECPACGEQGTLFQEYEVESDDWGDEGPKERPEHWEEARLVDDSDLADRF